MLGNSFWNVLSLYIHGTARLVSCKTQPWVSQTNTGCWMVVMFLNEACLSATVKLTPPKIMKSYVSAFFENCKYILRTGVRYIVLKVVLYKDIINVMSSIKVIKNTTYFLSLFFYNNYLDFRQLKSWIPKVSLYSINISSSSPKKQYWI